MTLAIAFYCNGAKSLAHISQLSLRRAGLGGHHKKKTHLTMSLKRSILKLVSPSQHCFTPITPIYTRTSLSLSSNHIRPFSTSRPSFAKKAFTRGSCQFTSLHHLPRN